MVYFLLPLTGIFVGLLSTIFGVGGGIIAVPILYLLFPKISPQLVISSSMGMIFINSILNTPNFSKQGKKISIKNILPFTIGMALGVTSGVKVVKEVSPETIKIYFGITVLLVAFKVLLSKANKNNNVKSWTPSTDTPEVIKYLISCYLGGFIAGTTGLGGGAILVPIFISLLMIPYNWVSFLSNICMGSGALVGILIFLISPLSTGSSLPNGLSLFQVNSVNFALITLLSSGALISSKWGVKISENMEPQTSKRLFATLLFVVSIKILYNSFSF